MTRFSNLLFAVILLAWAAPARSEEKVKVTDTTQVTATSPKEACEKIGEAAKKDDFNTVKQLTATADMGKHHMMNESHVRKEFEKQRQTHMDQLKELKCSSEQVVDDHAVVTAEAKEGKRLIPFTKEGDTWKFDAHTYMSFYRSTMKDHGHMDGTGTSHKGKG